MSRKVLLAASLIGMLLLLYISCSSLEQSLTKNAIAPKGNILFEIDPSKYPANIVIGISGPYSTQERMVQEGIISCARLIALSEAIAVDNRIVTQWDSNKGLRSFATEGNAYYDNSVIGKIIDRLEIVSFSIDKEAGAIVVACDITREAFPRPLVDGIDSQEKPRWLYELPESDEYRFGVGMSGPYRFLNDSLEAADFEAAQDLLARYTDQLYSKAYSKVSSSKEGEMMETGVYQASEGLLEGFMVVARYFDAETNLYWTLAAVPK